MKERKGCLPIANYSAPIHLSEISPLVSWSVGQPPVGQSLNQSVSQSVSKSVCQSVSQSVCQSVSWSIDQFFNQLVLRIKGESF